MWGKTGIGVVIYGRIRKDYLCFTCTPVFIVRLVSENSQLVSERMKEVRVMRVTFHILPTRYLYST